MFLLQKDQDNSSRPSAAKLALAALAFASTADAFQPLAVRSLAPASSSIGRAQVQNANMRLRGPQQRTEKPVLLGLKASSQPASAQPVCREKMYEIAQVWTRILSL